jgi:hypothetical protein
MRMDGHVHVINRQFSRGGGITDSYPDYARRFELKLAAVLDLEGGFDLDGDLDMLRAGEMERDR